METIISPSILSADFANLERDIRRVTDAGAKWVHVDVMDGHFVPNITIGAPVVKSLRKITNAMLDVHLMISEPQKYVKDFVAAGSDIITFHLEAQKDLILDIIKEIKSADIMAGLSIKPKTPVDEIKEFIPYLDLVLIMTVEPGFGGQRFMHDCVQKIADIKEYARILKKENLYIQVDGGINDKTANICKSLGANSLVAGSYVFGSSDIASALKSLL
ncbi:TPA: ribulose-phosphate 3-epimerase [Candidatus Galligastranaerophilus faecipullorum]|nr:ribulose-phosphate 3-epimerase [Candidatus Galligastranaerophilus faecipullorum]